MSTAHPESPPAGIYSAMAAIMGEVSPIAKDQRNNEQKFQYRGIDDVYNALNPLFAEHRVFMVPTVTGRATDERTTKNGNIMSCVTLTVEYRFFHADGSCITCTVMGEGRDTADKATNKAMAAAHKYALLQTFCIPTADLGRDDPDHETLEGITPRGATAPQRVSLGSIKQTLAGLATVKDIEAYWPKVRVREDHPDYQQLANLFVARKKELLQAAPEQASPEQASPAHAKPHVTLAAARTAFAECTSAKELEACARSLAIAKDHPDRAAISEAYKERGKALATQADSQPEAQAGTQPTPITPEQITAIQTAYSGWSREDRLMDISRRLGRSINSVKELSLAEASALLESFAQPEAAA